MHQRETRPAVLFQPRSAKEVAVALILCTEVQCRFAVKSGGHAAMKGASSADGGVTIDLKYLNSIELNEDKTIANIGAGNRWGDVFETLGKDGLAVAGGRAGDVGVGGYTLGGGLSFFASAQGWGCDTVRNYELVTAAGSIINVTHQDYPDLYWALRGGGKNFGIVTRFDYETFAQGDVFAGSLLFDYEHRIDVIKAFNNYHATGDPKAATWLSIAYSKGHKLMSALAMYADPDPDHSILQPYLSIPTIYNTAKVRSMASITREIADVNVKDHRQNYTNHTFKYDPDFVSWVADMYWEEMDIMGTGYATGQGFVIVMQIYTKESCARMQRNGGNCLSLNEADAPYLNILAPSAWLDEKDDDVVFAFVEKVFGRAVEEGKRRGLHRDFIYMNYASERQDVLKGYGEENYQRLKRVAEKYDPNQVFQKLAPGYFKFGGAPA
jgi:FAD/FMN-containing dehydrogenase